MAAVAMPARRLPVVDEPRPPLRLVSQQRSLAEVLDSAWAGLQAEFPVACPVCDGRMEPRVSAGSRVVGGLCRSCGTELS